MHKPLPLIAAAALIVCGLGVAVAQECAGQHCVYAPQVQAPGTVTPTATPLFGPIPPVLDGPCTVHEPAPVEGGQAWLTSYNLAPGEQATLCVRLIVGGQAVAHALAFAVVHYPDREFTIDGQRGGSNGVTILPFAVGAVRPGQLVVIDAVAYDADRAWPARTQFLSQPAPTMTPTTTPIPAPTVTPTNTPVPPTLTPTATP